MFIIIVAISLFFFHSVIKITVVVAEFYAIFLYPTLLFYNILR